MAAVARTEYQLSAFNINKAKAYSLVAMVKEDVELTKPIYNINDDGQKNTDFKGAGIAKYKGNTNTFLFSANGETFTFATNGVSADSESSGYKLVMASIVEKVSSAGIAVTGTQSGSATREADGSISDGGVTYETKTLVVDNLNARDHFAVEIMNGIINKLEEDPTMLSDAAISHYCQQAYRYASFMMIAAANARGTFDDDTESSASARQEAIGELDNNSDKLLNNMIVALERTDAKTVVDGREIYSEQVTLMNMDSLNAKLDAIKNEMEAFKTNVTTAMTNMQSVMTNQLAEFRLMVTQLTNINASLQSFTQNMVTAMNNVNGNVSATRSDISDLQDDVNDIDIDVNSIKSTTNTINTNLNTVKEDVAIIKRNTTPV